MQNSHVLFEVKIPIEGGSPVHTITIEAIDLDNDNASIIQHFKRTQNDFTFMQCFFKDLKASKSYVFRCRVESFVGFGKFSVWTEEIKLPN
jgi:hypothetical protein